MSFEYVSISTVKRSAVSNETFSCITNLRFHIITGHGNQRLPNPGLDNSRQTSISATLHVPSGWIFSKAPKHVNNNFIGAEMCLRKKYMDT